MRRGQPLVGIPAVLPLAPYRHMPTDAADSLALARAARESGNLPECLYRATAAVGYARREQDHESAFQALQCMGRLHLARQEPREARGYYEQAASYVKEQGMIQHVGGAYHDLVGVGVELGDRELMGRSAAVALEFYGKRGRRVSILVADMALVKLDEDASFAYHAWRAAGVGAATTRDRLIAAVNTLDAASRTSPALFRQHWTPVLTMLETAEAGELLGNVLCLVSECGLRCGMIEQSWTLADKAVVVATTRNEPKTRERAEYLRDRADSALSLS